MAVESQIEYNSKPALTGRKKHRSYSRLIVFLVCLAISVLMWVFIELMKDYSDEIKYSVSFKNLPKDLILTNSGDSLITVGLNAQGFELLTAKYAGSMRSLTIDLATLKVRPTADGYIAYMSSAKIIEQLGTQIRFQKEISYIKPDTLYFRFSSVYRKQVPVVPDIDFSLGRQYDITDSLKFRPGFVTVSSIQSIIDTITSVRTQKIRFNDLDSSIDMKVALYKGRNAALLKYSSDSVTVKVKIEKVTEAGFVVPLSVISNGADVKVFPDKVEIVCRVPLSLYPHISASDFSAQVVFDPAATKEKKLPVNVVEAPRNARVIKIVPAEVEYILISK